MAAPLTPSWNIKLATVEKEVLFSITVSPFLSLENLPLLGSRHDSVTTGWMCYDITPKVLRKTKFITNLF